MNDDNDLRDLYAGLALVGILAYPGELSESEATTVDEAVEKLSRLCFKYADAMLRARKEKP